MTQPAKVQEPSMEEILASIRRIIADDEAKPPVPDKAVSPAPAPEATKPPPPPPAAKPAVMKDAPPAKIAPAPKVAAPASPPAAPQPPQPQQASPPVAEKNSQDDIDALLAGLDESTSPEEVRPSQPDSEVFDLTDDMAVASPPPPQPQPPFRKIDPQDDLEFNEGTRPLKRQATFEPPALSSAPPAPPILSQSTVSAVESAFNALAHTVLSNNARTLEDLVREMLRPLLKAWLDDNLPGLVERIVKAEIERVSRGR
jgi:uncharacterized protein